LGAIANAKIGGGNKDLPDSQSQWEKLEESVYPSLVTPFQVVTLNYEDKQGVIQVTVPSLMTLKEVQEKQEFLFTIRGTI
jgi:hypothetical protein